MRIGWCLVAAAALCAGCGGGSGDGGQVSPVAPRIEFTAGSGNWTSPAIDDGLDDVSNNGLGYTGEIDVYELAVPAAGRLQISLSWSHQADFDLVVAADPEGRVRLAEGVLGADLPEYVGLTVAAGQRLWLLIAGWEGEPGDYRLETLLLPPEAPPFGFVEGPPAATAVARNRPLEFRFNADLHPDQRPEEHLLLVSTGHRAEGDWCIDGPVLRFWPRLPAGPTDAGGLHEGAVYSFQVPRAADGLRALNGELLDGIVQETVEVGALAPPEDGAPPRVLAVDHDPTTTWDGSPLVLTLSAALDPWTVGGRLSVVLADGSELPWPTRLVLGQPSGCGYGEPGTLTVEPAEPLPPATTVRLRVPGTVQRLGADPAGGLGLTGPEPAPAAAGVLVDFRTP